MIDNRQQQFPKNDTKLIARLCDRKFGIGADGLILLELSNLHDFTMIYYNADGNEGSMCGNGGRCIVAFAKQLKVIGTDTMFDAVDGLHEAQITDNLVSLKMKNVDEVKQFSDHLFLDTGSPHHISFVEDINNFDVFNIGKKIRYGAPYYEEGTNVNFVEQLNDTTFKIRTYERGVENETLSCGTGATAAAIAAHNFKKTTTNIIFLETLGGTLEISFDVDADSYKNVFLKGEANIVFNGEFEI
ncbi:UNVERIFIED_CONTAM: hypothetical protein GTU68_056929 [Idotea baltica]|nr:hypothetical protein [Idotea baltica]